MDDAQESWHLLASAAPWRWPRWSSLSSLSMTVVKAQEKEGWVCANHNQARHITAEDLEADEEGEGEGAEAAESRE
jgi:hypothetical protein